MADNETEIPGYQELMDKLSKAKSKLILYHPFIGTIALGLRTKVVAKGNKEGIPTAGVDGRTIYYNADFLRPLTDKQTEFLVAHECLHPMLEHNFREHRRDHMKWNRACDFVINQLLVEDGIGEFIPGGCLDKAVYDKGEGLAEGVYNILPQQSGGDRFISIKGNGQSGNDPKHNNSNGGKEGSAYDDIMKPDANSPAEESQMQADWKIAVAQAAQAAKQAGKLSAGMARLVDETLKPKVDWREVLRRFVQKAKSENRTWARPNRRFMTQGLIMPTISGETLGEIAFAIDCSGSIDQHTLSQFAAEIKAVKDEGNPVKIHVIYFDNAVCHYDVFGRDDDLTVAMHGGGGTAFSPVFRYMKDKDINPIACIFLTDLYCDDFGPPTPYPTLWVSTASDKAPWGEVVLMDKRLG